MIYSEGLVVERESLRGPARSLALRALPSAAASRHHVQGCTYSVLDKATIEQHVLGRVLIPLMDAFDHRRHLPRVAAAGSNLHPDDDLGVRIGAELNVVGRAETAIGPLHDHLKAISGKDVTYT
jgi:hypothetical protein